MKMHYEVDKGTSCGVHLVIRIKRYCTTRAIGAVTCGNCRRLAGL